MNIAFEFCIFKLLKVSIFISNKKPQIFGPNFPKLVISGLSKKRWILHHRNSLIQISLCTKFKLKQKNLNCLDEIYPKRALPVLNRKKEHHHGIQQNQIRLVTKYHLKQTILIFWIKFIQKGRKVPLMWNSDMTGSRNIGLFHSPYIAGIFWTRKISEGEK